MTTTTKNTSAAKRSHQNVEEAREILHHRRTELDATAEEIASIRQAWTGGDDSTPASAMSELKEEHARLTTLVSAAEKELTAASRRLLTDDPALAEAVAYALGTKFHGIKAAAASTMPKRIEDDLMPHLTVVQSKPHHDSGTGTVSGECSVRLLGPAWTRPLDADWLKSTLKRAGVRFKGDVRVSGNRADLEITYAHPEIPTIGHIATEPGSAVGVDGVEGVIESEATDGNGYALSTASASAGKIVSVSVSESGTRTTVIETWVTVRNSPRGYWTADQAVEHAQRAMSQLVGDPLSMFGRVSHVEHVKVAVTEPTGNLGRPGRLITSRFTTVSKVRK